MSIPLYKRQPPPTKQAHTPEGHTPGKRYPLPGLAFIMKGNLTPSPERHRHEPPSCQQNQHCIRQPYAHRGARRARAQPARASTSTCPCTSWWACAGVSGSGKSSLALGVLYAEGSRRYLEALSTYTRRRMTTASRRRCGQASNTSPPRSRCTSGPRVPGIRSHLRHA